MRLIAVALAAGALAAGPVKVTLTAPTHTPKIKTKWYYTVRARAGGKAASAQLTAQIVDPVGGVNPVMYGSTNRPIKNFRFKGAFRDYIIWPGESRGIRLTLRLTVRVGTARKVLSYWVTPH